MSERHSDNDFKLVLLLLVMVVWFAYLEIDSRIQLSQLKDLQRRVGELEQRK